MAEALGLSYQKCALTASPKVMSHCWKKAKEAFSLQWQVKMGGVHEASHPQDSLVFLRQPDLHQGAGD